MPQEIYPDLTQLKQDVKEIKDVIIGPIIEGKKQPGLADIIATHNTDLYGREDHPDTGLTSDVELLKKWRWYQIGFAAGMIAIIQFIISFFKK